MARGKAGKRAVPTGGASAIPCALESQAKRVRAATTSSGGRDADGPQATRSLPTAQSPAASTGGSTALPPTGNRRRSTNEAITDMISMASTGVSSAVTRVLPSLDRICNSVRSVGEEIVAQISALREDLRKQNDVSRKEMKALVERIIEGSINQGSLRMSTEEIGDQNLWTKAALMFDVMKFLTCVQFLDKKEGHGLFCNMTTNSGALIEAAKLVNGPEGMDAFLNSPVPDKHREKVGTTALPDRKRDRAGSMTVAAFACRGQGRAHDNIRKCLIKSFEAACPNGHSLNPASNGSEEQKRQCAKLLFTSGTFKFDDDYTFAWISACKAAVMEAKSTASAAEAAISEKKSLTLPEVPSPDLSSPEFEMSLYSLGFVSMKVTKYMQSVGKARGTRMNKSHGPFWAKEVLFLNDSLLRQLQGEDIDPAVDGSPILLRELTAHRALHEDEIEKMRSLIECEV